MTIEDINRTVAAAVTNQRDRRDFVSGNFSNISERHPGEIVLSDTDLMILNEALNGTDTLQGIASNLVGLLNLAHKQ